MACGGNKSPNVAVKSRTKGVKDHHVLMLLCLCLTALASTGGPKVLELTANRCHGGRCSILIQIGQFRRFEGPGINSQHAKG